MRNLQLPILLLALALLAACGGAEDRKSAYIEKGAALLAAGNFEKARLEFQNALQIDPKDLEARFKLAETLEKLQQWQGAARQYLAILGEQADHRGALLRMGRLYLLSGADDKAREHAEKILALAPEDPEALVLLAGTEAKAGNAEEARLLAEKALSVAPKHVEASSIMSSLLLVAGDAEGSIRMLEEAIAAHPEEVALKINLARVFARAGRLDQASDTFAAVVAAKPDELAYRRAYARFLMQIQRPDEAGRVLEQAKQDFPDDETAKLAYVEYLSGTRGIDAAVEELKAVIAAEPGNSRYEFALGKVYEAAARIDDAATLYDDMTRRYAEGPDHLSAKSRLAVIRTRQQDLAAARRLVEEVLSENPRAAEALALRGTLLLNDGDAAGAIADFRTVLRDEPGNVPVIRLLARAHQTNGEPELARDVLSRGMETNPTAGALGLDLANQYARANDIDNALETLEKVLEKSPGDALALEGRIKILVHRKAFDDALETAERLKAAHPDNVKGYYFAGLVRQAKGDIESSIGEFQSALDRSPAAIQPLSQLIKSYLALERRDDAIAKLNEVLASQPNNYVALNLRGELEFATREFAAATASFEAAIGENAGWAIPYRNLASVKAAQKDADGAIAAMQRGIEATGGSPLLVTGLAAFHERNGNLDAAIAEYERVLADNPESELASNNLAMLLVEYREDEASWQRARALVEDLRNSEQAAYLDTVGWIEYKLGAVEQAILFLEKAVERAPAASIMRYHLGMALYAGGNRVGAREHLSEALAAGVEFRGIEQARTILEELDKPAG